MSTNYNKILTEFVNKQKSKAFAFLRKNYSLNDNDCEEVFQDSLLILWHKLQEVDDCGMANMVSTSTYFLSICKNKAREFLRNSRRLSFIIDDDVYDFTCTKAFKQENVDFLLTFDIESDIIKKEKEEQLYKLVENLPQPCDDLLWGFYRDELSLKELADKFNYKSEGTVKVTKHRCLQKLIERYNRL